MHDANYKISSFNGNSHVRSKFCAFLCVLIQVSLTVVSFLFISSVSHTDVNEPQNMNFAAGYCADTLGLQTPRVPESQIWWESGQIFFATALTLWSSDIGLGDLDHMHATERPDLTISQKGREQNDHAELFDAWSEKAILKYFIFTSVLKPQSVNHGAA